MKKTPQTEGQHTPTPLECRECTGDLGPMNKRGFCSLCCQEACDEAEKHLVSFGGHGGDKSRGRQLVAKALMMLRSIDPKMAVHYRKGLLYISGQFPIKEVQS